MTKRDPFDTERNALERDEIEFHRRQVFRRIEVLLDETMRTENGRELVFNLLEMSQVNSTSFNTNALSMAFNEGRRSFGLSLQGFINRENYLLMLEEANERRKQQSKRS